MASEAHVGAATTWGSPSTPKLAVLIHGWTSSSQTWIAVGPKLVKHGYYVVAPDLLGHGMAARSNSYQVDDLVADVLQHVSHRHIDLLIGHSLGGPVSLGLYAHLKTKPKRLVLVDPALEIRGEDLDAATIRNLEDVKTRPSAEEYSKRFPTWDTRTCVVKSLAASLADAHAVEYIGQKIRPWSFTKGLPQAGDGVEIVIIGADPQKDTVFKPAEAETLATNRSDVKCIVAIGSGHGIQREKPEIVVRAALEPLETL